MSRYEEDTDIHITIYTIAIAGLEKPASSVRRIDRAAVKMCLDDISLRTQTMTSKLYKKTAAALVREAIEKNKDGNKVADYFIKTHKALQTFVEGTPIGVLKKQAITYLAIWSKGYRPVAARRNIVSELVEISCDLSA